MTLRVLPYELAICRLAPTTQVPRWASMSRFLSLTQTDDELSLVVEASCVPPDVQANMGWSVMKLDGPIDFSMTGIIHALTGPAARERIGVFVISTFDTDYLLTKSDDRDRLIQALRHSGFVVVE